MRASTALPATVPTASPIAPRTLLAAGALAAVYLIWGSTYFAIRVALESFPPLLLGGTRFLVAGGVFYAVLRARGCPAPTRREWGASALGGLLFFVGGNGAIVLGQTHASSSAAAVVSATVPLWAGLLQALLGRRTTGREWLGLALGFAGTVALRAGNGLGTSDPRASVLLVGPLAFAVGSVIAPRLPLPRRAVLAAATQMLAAGPQLVALGLLRGETLPPTFEPRALVALLYLAAFGSVVGFTAYTWLLRHVRPALATSYAFVNPIVAVALGVGAAGESVGRGALFAALLVVAGVMLLCLRERDRG